MTEFYYKQVSPNYRSFSNLLSKHLDNLSPGGRFYFNLARTVGVESYIFREGEWSDPFKTAVEPQYIMPEYNSKFNFNFSEVSDLRACGIKKLIQATDRPMMMQWSGGIDSSVALVSLLKNLSKEELSRVIVCMSGDTALESPNFYNNFIRGNFKILDSEAMLINEYKEKYNAYVIVADTGDCIFGAELGNKLYPRMEYVSNDNELKFLYNNVSNADVPYERYKNMIISHFNRNLKLGASSLSAQRSVLDNSMGRLTKDDENFGEIFYEKIVKNIKTANVPIHSLHDFFWWTIFNGRFIHCGLRPATIYSAGNNNKKDLITDCIIQWFNSNEYQLWSMNNNNNGEKLIGPTQGLYKTAAKKYIYEFNRDEWYLHHKIKIVSGPNIVRRNWRKNFNEFDPVLGMDTDYNMIRIGNQAVDDSFINSLMSYKVDWC